MFTRRMATCRADSAANYFRSSTPLFANAFRGRHDRRARSRTLEQAHDALILFDVPAVLVVVSRDPHRTSIRAIRFPDARASHRSAFELHSRPAQSIELHVHSRQDAIELRDV